MEFAASDNAGDAARISMGRPALDMAGVQNEKGYPRTVSFVISLQFHPVARKNGPATKT
jgi:hypothetical protein